MKIQPLAVFLVLCLSVSAQENDPTSGRRAWSLEDCITYALENNISIKQVELDKNGSEENLKQSKYAKLPNLSSSTSQSFSWGSTIDPITSDFVSQQISATNVGLNTSVTLYNGNQLSNTVSQNRLMVEQNELYVQETRNNISLSILEAYVQILYNKESIEVAQNNLDASEKEVERARARLDAGTIAMIDYTDALSQAATNRTNLISAKNGYAQQIIALKQLLELDPTIELDIQPLDNRLLEGQLIPSKQDVYENAVARMPEIKASEMGTAISEKELDIAKGGFLPTLSLTGSLGSGYTSTNDLTFTDQLDVNFNQRLGLSLNVPIFSRYQNKAQVANAKIGIEQSKLQLQSAKKELYQKIETAWQNAVSAQEQVEASRAAKEAAEESYKLAQRKYELNALSTTDLVVSQNTYTNARLAYLQAKYLGILYSELLDFYQGNEIKL
ncbi:outer membrane protein [Flagellimonas taeanensis]|jgi:outer membrane protein|uniref:Outer membrane protein n=1 Tax=Flagellimonas taeanensis TaxID=1005926 RepID=A0A1M6YQX2_9FLAO|nr:TolC family protein [Allomuricauda taeanensis]MEE1963845.1 TolC family protein [Allomuricauda taeanensis]SFC15316.1 outer membrane protein [Allomuricauda taeanensis]SHL20540.1 outer membrane protein [Allomuricauda taeanensis]